MTDTTAPPLAEFDPAGTPTSISYQMPGPNRITGRHYLVLNFSNEDFATVTESSQNMRPAANVTAGAVTQAGTTTRGAQEMGATLTAAAPADQSTIVVVPNGIVLSEPTADDVTVVLIYPYTLSSSLAALTWGEVKAVGAAGKQLVIYRSASGDWHYRVTRPLPEIDLPDDLTPADTNGGPTPLVRAVAHLTTQVPPPDSGGGPDHSPTLGVSITSPDSRNPVTGPSDGMVLSVAGTCRGDNVTHRGVEVTVNGGNPHQLALDEGVTTWSAGFTITAGGIYTILATATAKPLYKDEDVKPVSCSTVCTVVLDAAPTGGTPTPSPIATITNPGQFTSTNEHAIVTVSGTVDANGGSPVTKVIVDIPDAADGATALDATINTDGTWSVQTELNQGRHLITATAVNADQQNSASVTAAATVVRSLPFRRLSRRLVLAETLEINCYNTGVAAGETVKVFSLLPGETATFSCSVYTKDETASKASSSVVDSNSTEASADFENTLNDEQNHKTTSSESLAMGLDVTVGAQFGVGSASVKGSIDDKSNSSREDTGKAVSTALNKHASKAAANRTVTINTESDVTHAEGRTDDSTRTIRNINVGRVLNYVYRRVLCQHLITYSLVDAELLDCTVDVMLDEDGHAQRDVNNKIVIRRHAQAYPLSDLDAFARANLQDEWQSCLAEGVEAILSNVADYTGNMQSLVEMFVPTLGNVPKPEKKYLRVRPGLTQKVINVNGSDIAAPGLVIRTESLAMPSDALAVDVILGGGLALDTYSQGLQEVAIDERRAQISREALAQKVVAEHDEVAAAIWAKVYPTAPVPTTTPAPPANG